MWQYMRAIPGRDRSRSAKLILPFGNNQFDLAVGTRGINGILNKVEQHLNQVRPRHINTLSNNLHFRAQADSFRRKVYVQSNAVRS